MDNEKQTSLKKLIADRDKILKQLEIIETGSPLYATDRLTQVSGIVEELTLALQEIEQSISAIGHG